LAVIALSIPATLYLSEIFRGSLESIDKSQFDAASSVGHTGVHTFFRIIVPQMIPVSLPMMGNVTVGMLKGVAIVSMVGGVGDMLSAAKDAAAINYRYLEAYVAAAIIYWALCFGIQKLFAFIEKYFKQKTRKAIA
jgi:L-cystine transport system permease protein